MEIGQIFSQGFKITNKNWPLILIQFILGIANMIIFFIFFILPLIFLIFTGTLKEKIWPGDFSPFAPNFFIAFITEFLSYLLAHWQLFLLLGILLLVAMLLIILLSIFVEAGTYSTISEVFLNSLPFLLNRFFDLGKTFFWRFLGLEATLWALVTGWFLLAVILLAPLIFLIVYLWKVAGIVVTIVISLILGGLVLGILFITVVILSLFITYTKPLLPLENLKTGEALKKGISFLKRNFWPALGLILLLFVVNLAIGFIFAMLRLPFSFIPLVGPIFEIPLALVQWGVMLYLSVFSIACVTAFCYDAMSTNVYEVKNERISQSL
ncbi:MAG: hypothetical protein AB1393_06220 [Candidatus Edwardsbacteria bacterium]